jgi:hypothetical protein
VDGKLMFYFAAVFLILYAYVNTLTTAVYCIHKKADKN